MNMDREMGTMTHKRLPLVKVAIPGAMLSPTENTKEEQSFDGVRTDLCDFFYSYSHHWLVIFSNMNST